MTSVIVQEEPRGPSVLIEIGVPNNGMQRVPLPDIAQLRSTTDLKIVIKGMRLISSNVLAGGIITAAVTAPDSELQKIALTLYAEGWEKGQTIPIVTMNDMVTPLPYRWNPTKFSNWVNVDFPKSYLQFANGQFSAGAPYVVLIDVEYVRLNAQNLLVTGPAQ